MKRADGFPKIALRVLDSYRQNRWFPNQLGIDQGCNFETTIEDYSRMKRISPLDIPCFGNVLVHPAKETSGHEARELKYL